MPCKHKFIDDLNLDNLGYDPTTLIVGTFNPSWPANNQAEWFYGRTARNYFWDVLPRLYGEASLINATHIEWKAFCKKYKIAITDLIFTIDDADEDNTVHQGLLGGFADNVIANDFNDYTFTDIVTLIQNHPSIDNVYLTRGNDPFWNALWNPISLHCQANDKRCIKLVTPSKNARFSMFAHNRRYPNNQYNMASLNDFILMKWQNELNQ
jgi:hypothetical protein